MSDKLENYMYDLSRLITEYAEEAKASAFRDEFQKGRLMAFYEIISLMRQQADIFDISSDKLGLADMTEDELFVPLMMLKKAG